LLFQRINALKKAAMNAWLKFVHQCMFTQDPMPSEDDEDEDDEDESEEDEAEENEGNTPIPEGQLEEDDDEETVSGSEEVQVALPAGRLAAGEAYRDALLTRYFP
jgi:hypothetical protein